MAFKVLYAVYSINKPSTKNNVGFPITLVMGIYANTGHCIIANTEDKKIYVASKIKIAKIYKMFLFKAGIYKVWGTIHWSFSNACAA